MAHFAKDGRSGNARATVAGFLRPDVVELPLRYPVTTEIAAPEPAYGAAIGGFYARAAAAVEAHLRGGAHGGGAERGRSAVLRLLHAPARAAGAALAGRGDPRGHRDVGLLVAGGAAAGAGRRRADRAAGHAGRGGAGAAARRQRGGVIMKVGRNLRADPAGAGDGGQARPGGLCRARRRWRATVTMRLADKADDRAPYFSMVLVPGWEARP